MVKTVADFLICKFQKLALENCCLDAPAVDAIAQNSGLQVSKLLTEQDFDQERTNQ